MALHGCLPWWSGWRTARPRQWGYGEYASCAGRRSPGKVAWRTMRRDGERGRRNGKAGRRCGSGRTGAGRPGGGPAEGLHLSVLPLPHADVRHLRLDRKSVVEGKGVAVRVILGGCRRIKKKKK